MEKRKELVIAERAHFFSRRRFTSRHVTIKTSTINPVFLIVVNENYVSSPSSHFVPFYFYHCLPSIFTLLFLLFVSVPGRCAIREKNSNCPTVLKSYIYARRTTDILYASFNRHIKRKLMHRNI